MSCTCGCVEPHVIATRETADGFKLRVWSDGSLTHANVLNEYVRGIGRARANWSRARDMQAVRDVADDISLFDLAELPHLLRAARSASRHTWTDAAARRRTILLRAHAACTRAQTRELRQLRVELEDTLRGAR